MTFASTSNKKLLECDCPEMNSKTPEFNHYCDNCRHGISVAPRQHFDLFSDRWVDLKNLLMIFITVDLRTRLLIKNQLTIPDRLSFMKLSR